MPFDWSTMDEEVASARPAESAKYLAEKRTLESPAAPAVTDDMSATDRFMAGMGASAENQLLGMKQLKAKVAGSPEEVQALADQYHEKRAIDKPLLETTAGRLGSATGDIALGLLPGTRAWKTPKAATATGAAFGLTQPNEDRSLLPNALEAVAGGVLSGGFAKLANKATNAAIGDFGNNAEAIKLDRNAREMYGVNLRPSDLPGTSPFWKYIDRLAPRIPFVGGLYGSSIEKQADEIAKIIKGEVVGPTGRIEQKNLLIEQVKEHANNLLKQNEDKWKNVYTIASGTAGTPKARRLNLREFSGALDEYLQKYGPAVFDNIEDKQLAAKLHRVAALRRSGGAVMTNFQNVRELQKAMGSLSRAMGSEFNKAGRPSLTKVRDTNKLYATIKADIDRWGTNPHNKPAYEAYRDATDFTKNEVVPFFDVNESTVAPRIVEGKFDNRPEELYGKLIDPKNRTELDRISERLPPASGTLMDIARNAKSSMKQLAGREETAFPFSTLAVPAMAVGAAFNPKTAAVGMLSAGLAEKGFGALERSQPFKKFLFASPNLSPETILRAGRGPLTAQAAPRVTGGLNALLNETATDAIDRSLFE